METFGRRLSWSVPRTTGVGATWSTTKGSVETLKPQLAPIISGCVHRGQLQILSINFVPIHPLLVLSLPPFALLPLYPLLIFLVSFVPFRVYYG